MIDRLRHIARWVKRRPWSAVLLLLGGFVAAATVLPEPGQRLNAWQFAATMTTIVVSASGGIALIAWYDDLRFTRGDRRERIRRLTRDLRDAVTAIDALRAEVEEGHHALEELERRVEVSRELAKLSDPQADAVRSLLIEQLEVESRRDFRRDVILGTLFFVLGILASRMLGSG